MLNCSFVNMVVLLYLFTIYVSANYSNAVTTRPFRISISGNSFTMIYGLKYN